MDNLKIIYKKTEDLIPYINNPRNNDGAVDKVASSIKNFGFKVPIVVDADNEIIAGHTRLKAAKKLGMDEVPCIVADDLNDGQIKAFRLADNRVAEFAEWDMELLESELEELEDMDFDMEDFDLGDIKTDNTGIEINNEGLDPENDQEIKMSFGKYKIIITEEELSALTHKFDQYITMNRVSYGFVRWLLG